MKKIELNKNWTICQKGCNEKYEADVPAMVMQVLYENGKIPDPYIGENEWEVYEVLKNDFEFTKTFFIEQDICDADEVLLKFEGLDTIASIYLNDKLLSKTSDMHRTYCFDVKKYVHVGENKLCIEFRSAINYALEQHEKEPYYKTSDTVNGFSLVRKAHCNYGWDWGPKLPDIGIWRNVSLLAFQQARFDDIYIHQIHEQGNVDLSLDIDIKRIKDSDLELEVCVIDPQGKLIAKVNENAREQMNCKLSIDNPQLWWCNGFGKQPLYQVECTLKANGVILDKLSKRIGLRTLTVRREKDKWGESFEFQLNGISIFAMGANYIPEDCFYTRCNKQRSEKLLVQCVKANYNCIRVWGGGYFCDDYFYDLCDEYGLIVWQDLLFACGVYRLHEEFVENVIEETKDNIRRLRHHACIGLWCGNNELEWGWSGWDMGFGNKLSDKADYLKLFEWILPRTVKEVDPDRFYWLASPSSGGSFDDPNDQNRGDVHYWDVWHRLKHFTEYRKYYFRFCSEFGFQSFPALKTIDTFAKKEDKNIFSPVMENHQKNGGANGLILYYLSANFLYPSDFSTLVYVSQILQAEAIRYGVEHWRSNRGRCMGSLYWQVNDCWPVASWSSIDYFFRWKPLHYYAKKFYAPILLSALEDKGIVRFVISNETREEASTKVVWRLRDNQGNILEEYAHECIAPALEAVECSTADFTKVLENKNSSRTQYLEYILFKDDQEVSRGTLLFCRPKHFEFLNPEITYSVKEDDDSFIISLKTENYAKYLTIDVDGFDFVASENCFDISKGEEKILEIKKEDITKNGNPTSVQVSDFNEMKILSAFDIR